MAEWFRFLPLWAKVYWLLTAQPLALPIPWPTRVRLAAAGAWTNAYMRWVEVR